MNFIGIYMNLYKFIYNIYTADSTAFITDDFDLSAMLVEMLLSNSCIITAKRSQPYSNFLLQYPIRSEVA